jgi:excisionase family DNA binding protein
MRTATDDPVAHAVMTVHEAAQSLRLPLRTMYSLIDKGEVPAIRLGRRRMVLREVVEGILDQGRRPPTVHDI